MTAATLTYLPVQAGGLLAGTLGRGSLWALARFMRAPFVISAVVAMVGFSLLACNNALYNQPGRLPAPLFFSWPATATSAPSRGERHVAPVVPVTRPSGTAISALIDENTTGSVTPTEQAASPDSVGNPQVFSLQRKLAGLGYFKGTMDGYYGPKTAAAIRAFETATGLTPTGAMSPDVVKAIMKSSALNVPSNVASIRGAPPAPAQKIVPLPPLPKGPVAPFAARAVATAPLAPLPDATPAPNPAPSGDQILDVAGNTAANAFDAITQMVGALVDGKSDATPAPRVTPPALVAAEPAPAPRLDPTPGSSAVAMNVMPPAHTMASSPQAQNLAAETGSTPPSEIPMASATANVPDETSASDPQLVEKIQRGLASLGFLGGTINGVANEATAKAIRNFELFYNFKVTGAATPRLLQELKAQDAVI